ncbi:hypothetical protein [Bradyrhizobium sp. 144]|uniref:hypothetical protein n=1 Tax=Bradyrhizobium sp. 144 TaxID=2782620 RepID=UPI001FF944C4|nr:hypothetical protein [Bradyrhizobium sp. 144]MCK1695250.1 hypothetical protein [Bradyrhizobium sp. 144]
MDIADRKCERDPVNETKPALFFSAGNDRVADHTDTEIFATMTSLRERLVRSEQAKAGWPAQKMPDLRIFFICTKTLVSGWRRVHKLHSRFAHNNANSFHRQLCERRHRVA